jgi:hypothetical protein
MPASVAAAKFLLTVLGKAIAREYPYGSGRLALISTLEIAV